MIDTIVLILSEGTYQITQPEKFVPDARLVLGINASRAMLAKQNSTKKELLRGIYKPRLTLLKRFNLSWRKASPDKLTKDIEVALKIELSLPKLLFGNNFNELQSKDFPSLITKLQPTLQEMGVQTSKKSLSTAAVSAVHYSKNIPLMDGSTPYHFISKIKEANIQLSLDVNQTDYRNDGHSYKWHCNSYEVVFYDKIRDLEKAKTSDKRAIEKDNAIQMRLFDTLPDKKKFEILRMEVRLNKRTKIKQLFKKLHIKSDLTFKSLFKRSISRTVLLHYIDELEGKRPMLLDYKATDKALLTDLIFNNPKLTHKRIFQLYGLKKATELIGIRELRGMFGKSNQRSWNRLMVDVKEVKLVRTPGVFNIIRDNIITLRSSSNRMKSTHESI
jgi:hypothetical protein